MPEIELFYNCLNNIYRDAPKVIPPMYFHGNYNRCKKRSNTVYRKVLYIDKLQVFFGKKKVIFKFFFFF